jgi:hypothetical protein
MIEATPCRHLWGALLLALPLAGAAGPAADALPLEALLAGRTGPAPVSNAAFLPGAATPGVATPDVAAPAAPELTGALKIRQSRLETAPVIEHPLQRGRDARLLPAVTIDFFTLGDLLVPVERGEMLREEPAQHPASYWRVIAQVGRVWREPKDGDWSRAAFPLMLVNDTENHAHQGLATFVYRQGRVSAVTVQFVQQSAPYLLGRHFVAWGTAPAEFVPAPAAAFEAARAAARAELTARLPARPWAELVSSLPPHTLDGFGGPLKPQWLIEAALIRAGTLYYQESATPYGPYPYPLEMRFGVRSIMKSVGAPLSLLRLAQVYGPWVLTLKIGDYVPGLDPKWRRIRFLDAANMASGFGGTGSLRTQPNDIYDGYLEGDYDGWYTAPSHAEKLAAIARSWHPYPWEPGTVVRYRDQDFYLLGVAIDAFLKSMRGPKADVWEMLKSEVLAPIGIQHAPAVRTQEPDGREGQVWFNAGFYPTLDDLAKIALLYQAGGAHGGQQLLNRQLTLDLLAARDALQKDGDASVRHLTPEEAGPTVEFYKMGFHFPGYVGSASGQAFHLPSMMGSGENEVTLYPNQLISILMAKAALLPPGEKAKSDSGPETARAVDRMMPF